MTTAEKTQIAISTTLTGIAIVFGVLILLTFIISLFGKVMQAVNNRGEKKKAKKEAEPVKVEAEPDTVAVIKAPPAATSADDDELLAVIAAAVYAYGQSSGKQYAVKSVRRAERGRNGRSAWAAAGVSDNVRTF